MRELIRQYVRHYERLVMYAGPVYDTDSEGPGPFYELALNSQRVEKEFGADGSELGLLPTPTHLFVILLRCNGQWAEGFIYINFGKHFEQN